MSSPARGRGLKPYKVQSYRLVPASVVPRKGTWIETTMLDEVYKLASCRPPQGDVD